METSVFEKFARYLELEKGMKPNSIHNALQHIKYAYMEFNDDLLIKARTYQQIRDVLLKIGERRHWSRQTIYKSFVWLKTFFTWAYERERIVSGENPFRNFDYRKGPSQKPEFLTEDQLEKLIFHPHLTVRDIALLSLLTATGIRRGECQNLNLEDIDFKNRLVHIRLGKRDKWRSVPFDRITAMILKFYIRTLKAQHYSGPALFISEKWNRISPNQISKRILRIGRSISLKARPHMLRHSLGRRIVMAGGDLSIVKEILGHANLNQASVYTHFTTKDLRKSYDRFLGSVGSLGK